MNRLGYPEIFCDVIFAFFLLVAWRFPRLGDNFFSAIERFGIRLSRKKNLAVVSLLAAAMVLPVSLLWLLPIPVPLIQDEFVQLLAGDTFAHGRLTNPTHPLWIFFDTIHVNQHPTYMSKYPPAQGALLALGQLLGHPWIGVLLGAAGMSAAVLWMLQGWMPPRWALLGGILVLLRVGISSYWTQSYWGGAVPAIGGALVLGALPRLKKFHRARESLILALGASLLANSRPVEGLIICAPALLVLLWWLCGKRSPPWRVTLPRLVVPFSACMLLCGLFIGYYNWRLTGKPLLFSEALNEQTYATMPDLIWQQPGPEQHYANAQFEYFYNGWARRYWARNRIDNAGAIVSHAGTVILKFVYFFLWPELCVLLLALPRVLRDRRTRYLSIQIGLCALGWYAIFWFLPHYAAPATAVVFGLLIQAMRHVRRFEHHGRPVGIGITRVCVLFALILAPFNQRGGITPFFTSTPSDLTYRAKFIQELDALPGQHLIVVRYGQISDGGQWINNDADIDHSKIVWAREIPGIDLRPLLDYFHNRDVWLVEPDAQPPRLTKFQ